ncbi:oocyte zinc finger protein XlCOF8.4-like, partial [Discoglossus pictus]
MMSPVVPKIEQEGLNLRDHQMVSEEESPVNISKGFKEDLYSLSVKEEGGDGREETHSDSLAASNSLITNKDMKKMTEKILNHSLEIIYLLTGEVPIKCGDVAVYFSMEEWEYIEGHKELYKDVMMENHQTLRTLGIPVNRSSASNSLMINTKMSEKILTLTLEIIVLLSGELGAAGDVIMRTREVSLLQHLTNSTKITEMKDKMIERILSHSQEIIHLLTGEVPIKCGDVVVYFSMEEWEYIEGHKELYKDVMMENHQTLRTLEIPVNRSSDIYLEEETNARSPQHIKEEDIPVTISEGGSEVWNTLEENNISYNSLDCVLEDVSVYHSYLEAKLKTYTGQNRFECSECGKCLTGATSLKQHMRIHTGDKPFACFECGKSFCQASQLNIHMRTHTGEKTFACSECGKC